MVVGDTLFGDALRSLTLVSQVCVTGAFTRMVTTGKSAIALTMPATNPVR